MSIGVRQDLCRPTIGRRCVKALTLALTACPPAVMKKPKPVQRDSLRMGLPSKGRMAEDTIDLLKVGRQPMR